MQYNKKSGQTVSFGSFTDYDIVGVSEIQWEESHDWSAGMGGYLQFRRDGQLYIREKLDCTVLAIRDDTLESIWMRIKQCRRCCGCLLLTVHLG